jgi:hypothetical protein
MSQSWNQRRRTTPALLEILVEQQAGDVLVFSETASAEPHAAGYYLDRDGDIWEKEEQGWRLILQRGVAVDPVSLWDWVEGHVRDYAPFMPVAMN